MKEYKIVSIPVDAIETNKWNPNRMSSDMLASLVKTLSKDSYGVDFDEEKFNGAILVRQVGPKYELIDGEHRWRAVTELGADKIDAIVLNLDEYDAIIKMLNMNQLRGNLDTMKTASLVATLYQEEQNKQDILDKLAIDQDTIMGMLEISGIETTTLETPHITEEHAPDQNTNGEGTIKVGTFSIQVTDEQLDYILQVINTTGAESTQEAIKIICDELNGDWNTKLEEA